MEQQRDNRDEDASDNETHYHPLAPVKFECHVSHLQILTIHL